MVVMFENVSRIGVMVIHLRRETD
ncbi:uncharacterized protein METZ01_LOCUS314010 [marine metagenome]|uniref:Uncharacterized protein n=1 Tax=marine metagenome TaxID=408172 RepID=A0A382NJ76_9ZZZZ